MQKYAHAWFKSKKSKGEETGNGKDAQKIFQQIKNAISQNFLAK